LGVNVSAVGLGAVFAFFGGTLLVAGFYMNNGQETNGGWILIGLAFFMWLISFFLGGGEKGHGRWHL